MSALPKIQSDEDEARLAARQAALLGEAGRELAPGEIRERWAAAILDGPRPVINLRPARFAGSSENG